MMIANLTDWTENKNGIIFPQDKSLSGYKQGGIEVNQ
jgi:hypothetical protein